MGSRLGNANPGETLLQGNVPITEPGSDLLVNNAGIQYLEHKFNVIFQKHCVKDILDKEKLFRVYIYSFNVAC